MAETGDSRGTWGPCLPGVMSVVLIRCSERFSIWSLPGPVLCHHKGTEHQNYTRAMWAGSQPCCLPWPSKQPTEMALPAVWLSVEGLTPCSVQTAPPHCLLGDPSPVTSLLGTRNSGRTPRTWSQQSTHSPALVSSPSHHALLKVNVFYMANQVIVDSNWQWQGCAHLSPVEESNGRHPWVLSVGGLGSRGHSLPVGSYSSLGCQSTPESITGVGA